MNTCSLVVIPSALLMVNGIVEFEDWMLDWKPTTTATMMDELRAYRALRLERFVRRNVSIQTFVKWKQENPRTFISERVQMRIAQETK